MFMCGVVLCCWKRVFAITNAISWQNSVRLCPASFCTPRPNLPVTPGRPDTDFLLLHSSPLWWKEHFFFFLMLALEGLVGLHRTIQLHLFLHSWLGHRPGLLWLNGLSWKPQRSFCQFWDCTQILHFRLFSWL